MGSFYNRAFINDDEVWVTIPDNKNIPFVGMGPITKPIRITKDNYNVLIKLGYKVNKLTTTELIRKPLSRYYNDTTLVKNKIDENNIIDEKPIDIIETENKDSVDIIADENKEECNKDQTDDVKDTKSRNIVDLDKQNGEEQKDDRQEYNVDTMTKDQLKQLLDLAGVPYKYKNTVDELRQLVRNNIEID